MIALLLFALQFHRPYHVETVASMARSTHTHVEVTGKVTLVRKEADGDWHLRISDGLRFIVAEIIPTLQPLPFTMALPTVGACVRVRGIRRVDNEAGHGWLEIHPVEELEIVPCR